MPRRSAIARASDSRVLQTSPRVCPHSSHTTVGQTPPPPPPPWESTGFASGAATASPSDSRPVYSAMPTCASAPIRSSSAISVAVVIPPAAVTRASPAARTAAATAWKSNPPIAPSFSTCVKRNPPATGASARIRSKTDAPVAVRQPSTTTRPRRTARAGPRGRRRPAPGPGPVVAGPRGPASGRCWGRSSPHPEPVQGEIRFDAVDGVVAVVEHRRREYGVRARAKRLEDVSPLADAAGGDHGHAYGSRHRAQQLHIGPRSRAVALPAGEQDLPRTQTRGLPR